MHIAMVCAAKRRYARFLSCILVHNNAGLLLAVAATATAVVLVAAAKEHEDQEQEQDIVVASAKTHLTNLLSASLHYHHMIPAQLCSNFLSLRCVLFLAVLVFNPAAGD
jgi:hypothetical protein